MTERLEAFESMVGPHPAGADTTKRQVLLCDLHNDIIDADSSGGGATDQGSFFLLVITEVIRSEWARLAIDVADSFFEIVIGANREQRAEQFLLHHF